VKKKKLRLRGQDCLRSTTTQCSDEQGKEFGDGIRTFLFLLLLVTSTAPALAAAGLGSHCPAPSNPTATFLKMRTERWKLAEDKGLKPPPPPQQQQQTAEEEDGAEAEEGERKRARGRRE
jgi:hypothetical protein